MEAAAVGTDVREEDRGDERREYGDGQGWDEGSREAFRGTGNTAVSDDKDHVKPFKFADAGEHYGGTYACGGENSDGREG